MQRYHLVDDESGTYMIEEANGEYVRYGDHAGYADGWNHAIEAVAKLYDGCSCLEPCDDYGGGVNMGCSRGIAAMIRAMKP